MYNMSDGMGCLHITKPFSGSFVSFVIRSSKILRELLCLKMNGWRDSIIKNLAYVSG